MRKLKIMSKSELYEIILKAFRNRTKGKSIYSVSKESEIEEKTIYEILEGKRKTQEETIKKVAVWICRDILRPPKNK